RGDFGDANVVEGASSFRLSIDDNPDPPPVTDSRRKAAKQPLRAEAKPDTRPGLGDEEAKEGEAGQEQSGAAGVEALPQAYGSGELAKREDVQPQQRKRGPAERGHPGHRRPGMLHLDARDATDGHEGGAREEADHRW